MADYLSFLALAAGMAIIAMTVRSAHREMGMVFSLLCGAALFLLLTDHLAQAVQAFRDMAQLARIGEAHLSVILKVLGVSLMGEFAAQSCRDAGEESLAMRVELGGKIMLVVLSLPLLQEIVTLIVEMTA